MAAGARGTIMAFNSSALLLGGVVGPVIIGFLLDRGGFELAAPVAAALGLAALALARMLLEDSPSAQPV